MKKSILSLAVLGFVGIYLVTGCGSSSSSTASNPNAVASASIAVTNPTGTSSTSTASLFKSGQNKLWSAMDALGLSFVFKHLGLIQVAKVQAADSTFTGCSSATGDLVDACASPATLDAEIATITTDTTGARAATELANFVTGISGYRAGCYGPGWTDNANGGSVNRPTGDLGMVNANLSSTDTTACASGQLTALLAGYPSFANDILKFQAAIVAALQKGGKDASTMAVGATLDAEALLPTITGFTATTATITRYADTSDGFKVFYTTFSGTDASSKAVTAHIYQVALSTDGSASQGVIKATFPHTATMGGTGTNGGLSMVYNKSADDTVTYELRVTNNRSTNSSDFFATDGTVDYSKTASSTNGEDYHVIRAKYNSTTNLNIMHYAWQAGGSDPAVRAFAIHIPAGTSGALTGTAYFGFGNPLPGLLTTAANPGGASIWATEMNCDWVTQFRNAPVSRVQKQTMTQSGSKFISSTALISFAPSSTCLKGSTYTISGSTPSDYNGTHAAVTSGDADYLTTYTANDIPAVTVTYPFAAAVLPSAP